MHKNCSTLSWINPRQQVSLDHSQLNALRHQKLLHYFSKGCCWKYKRRIIWCKAGLQSRIPENIGSRDRIFYPTPEVRLNHLLHRTHNLRILIRAYWNGTITFETFIETYSRILAVYHDFHWLLVAKKLLTAKLHSRHVKVGNLERSESDILPPTTQPWCHERARGVTEQNYCKTEQITFCNTNLMYPYPNCVGLKPHFGG